MKTVSKTLNRHCFNPRLRAALAVPAVLLGLAFAAAPARADDPIDLRPVATTAVTASTAYSGYPPWRVSDWSGMTGTFPDGLDDTSGSQWSSDGSQDPSLDWIAWDLGDTYTLSKVHVWNDNAYGDGIKSLDIQTSSDGSNWHSTPYTGLSWPQAPQLNGYPGFDQVFSPPITTRYIRFANFVSYGGYGTSGSGYYYVALDEVVFYELAGTRKDIKSFSVLGNAATISGTNITQFVPFGTDLKTITPTITAAALATVSPASGVHMDFSAVNPQTYTVISGDHSRTNLYAVTVAVVNGLVVKTYIGVTGSTGNLDPISKLMALTPSATSIQVSNIDYHNGVWSVPGSPSGDNFSILWDGWFDVLAAGGWGDYTFGTSSDDGSVVYLDLNRDGNFADPGDLIVSNNAVQPVTAAVGTVTLNRDSVRIVIGYFQAGGSYEMSAGWAPGTVTDFSSLNLINGTSGYFFSYDPYAPPQLAPSSFSMPLGVPTFTGVPTVSGHSYWLVYKDNLAGPGTWTQLGSGWFNDGCPHTFTDTTTPLPAARFYRLEKR